MKPDTFKLWQCYSSTTDILTETKFSVDN